MYMVIKKTINSDKRTRGLAKVSLAVSERLLCFNSHNALYVLSPVNFLKFFALLFKICECEVSGRKMTTAA